MNDILYKHQQGFRIKHCNVHPIIHFLDHCTEANNTHNPEYSFGSFMCFIVSLYSLLIMAFEGLSTLAARIIFQLYLTML